MDIRRIGAIKDREEVVGNQTRVKIVKNKLAPPFKTVEFDIMYGEGISKTGRNFRFSIKHGLLRNLEHGILIMVIELDKAEKMLKFLKITLKLHQRLNKK